MRQAQTRDFRGCVLGTGKVAGRAWKTSDAAKNSNTVSPLKGRFARVPPTWGACLASAMGECVGTCFALHQDSTADAVVRLFRLPAH